MNTLIAVLLLLTVVRLGYSVETYSSGQSSVSVEEYSSSNDSTDSSEKDESVSVEELSSSNDSSDSSEEDDIDYEDTIIYPESIPDCGNDTNMNATIRMVAYSLHIVLRGDLANGQVKNGNRTEAKNFPSASDMSLLTYDCGLEQSAFNISKMCRHESDLNFSNVGSNSAFYAGKIDDVHQLIHKLIYGWWNTSMQSFPLSKATPTASDSGMIPFLQMANANTTKIGCAYSECNSGRDGCDDSSSSIVLVCSYGTAHIQPNTPIYTEGRPCDTCNNTCAYKSLCNRTMSELECH
ncbi:hypothetical protein KIN20_013377 [Parelaphostrongylus tenuis]|uniref:SCP domain-containing protein n=1 Tax=Parelaphostrongylus tenuis TaxID=148309 RepID=A0AAD5QNS3_PARTN|nr:hypothetical protein KIN20_013377 [Parelaphostrongylus tenuis]